MLGLPKRLVSAGPGLVTLVNRLLEGAVFDSDVSAALVLAAA